VRIDEALEKHSSIVEVFNKFCSFFQRKETIPADEWAHINFINSHFCSVLPVMTEHEPNLMRMKNEIREAINDEA
jgi:hypothetical protein